MKTTLRPAELALAAKALLANQKTGRGGKALQRAREEAIANVERDDHAAQELKGLRSAVLEFERRSGIQIQDWESRREVREDLLGLQHRAKARVRIIDDAIAAIEQLENGAGG